MGEEASQSIRLKVTLQGFNLVCPVLDLDRKVSDLMKDIAKDFEDYVAPQTSPSIIIQELWLDGYRLNPQNDIRRALRDDDILIAIDEDTLTAQSLAAIDKVWFNLPIDEFSKKEGRLWVSCARLKSDKIVIMAGTRKGTIDKAITLEKMALLRQPDGQKLVFECKEDRWSIQVFTISEGGVVKEFEARVKPPQYLLPAIRRWEINVGPKLTPGKEHNIQEAGINYQELPPIILPPPARTGSSFSPPSELEEQRQPKLANALPSDCPLGLMQMKPVVVYQNYPGVEHCVSANTDFPNVFLTAINLINQHGYITDVNITGCESHFLNSNNEWEEWDNIYIGVLKQRPEGDAYVCRDAFSPFTLGSKGRLDFAIRTDKIIYDRQFYKPNRAHRSFPQPLKIRYVFKEAQGKSTEMIVTQLNPPLTLPTPESLLPRISKHMSKSTLTPLWYFYADDLDYDMRHYVSCITYEGAPSCLQPNIREDMLILSMNNSQALSRHLSKSELTKDVYNAAIAGISEVQCRSASLLLGTKYLMTIWILVDVENLRMKGFKVEAKTATSHVIEYFPPPPFMTLSPTTKRYERSNESKR